MVVTGVLQQSRLILDGKLSTGQTTLSIELHATSITNSIGIVRFVLPHPWPGNLPVQGAGDRPSQT